MNVEDALLLINKIQQDRYQPPNGYYSLKKINFEYRSYMHSAVGEIKECLINHQNGNAISLIEIFRHKVDNFACKTKSGDANFIFSIYYDVATDILDSLLIHSK